MDMYYFYSSKLSSWYPTSNSLLFTYIAIYCYCNIYEIYLFAEELLCITSRLADILTSHLDIENYEVSSQKLDFSGE